MLSNSRIKYVCLILKYMFKAIPYCILEEIMGKVSQCIFKWDEIDLILRKTAKQAYIIHQCIQNPLEDDFIRSSSTAEHALQRVPEVVIPRECDCLTMRRSSRSGRHRISMFSASRIPLVLRVYTQVNTLKNGGIEPSIYI